MAVRGFGERAVAGHHIKIISGKNTHIILVAQRDVEPHKFKDLKGVRPSMIAYDETHDNYAKEASRAINQPDVDGLHEVWIFSRLFFFCLTT